MIVVGALLAGGESRRMGQDKSALVIGGRTLAEHALATLAAVSDRQVILGHGRGCPADVPRLLDAVPGQGPSEGLRALVASGLGDTYLVLPVDMPGVTADHLRRLLVALPGHGAACFTLSDQLEPLPCALVRSAELRPGEKRLGALLAALQPARLALTQPEAESLRNLNHPEDLASEGRRRPPFG
ncbi:MAG: molybdenum cofactor guanylyltransferase [Deltaproteobacteria bacterium]|nr:molybdenum cofactor guanylyltransferase [Deltaproteobacteria bacterium]